ncbi:hypothetical protein KR51_00025830 [Rubidibacter lacunae KORDI 51-2]|uniref:DUF4340 domain-containing protein n=1 Tax=Rubidibacter lacunae KORDI 51-2 TaxID=582515 RepID=U5DIV8_9CHRO|nr:DUF4340 domain-containing protein [Rubidibacter lacunae]ERN40872.1 hypothetical protein KR51_00025830 [Rubidibacter lacunae KORDI 51-2]
MNRTTALLFVVAIALVGVIYLGRKRDAREAATLNSTESTQLLDFAAPHVRTIAIETETTDLEFVRTQTELDSEETDSEKTDSASTVWSLQQPEAGPASDAAVAYLLDALRRSRGDRVFPTATDALDEYGLSQPAIAVEIGLANGTTHTAYLGDMSFDGRGIYALVDPPADAPEVDVLLLPIDLFYAVQRPLAEWQQLPQAPDLGESAPATAPDVAPELPTGSDAVPVE